MRKLFLILLSVIVLSSCVYRSPFSDEPLFAAMGGDGDIVLTIDTKRVREGDFSSLIPQSVIFDRADRVSVSLGEDRYYGALEGNFGYAIVDAALAWSPEWKQIDDGERYYRSRRTGMEAAVPVSGALVFSSESYLDAVSSLISSRRTVIPPATSAMMNASLAALYTRNAEAAVKAGVGITADVADNIDEIVLFFNEGDGALLVSGCIDMDSSSSARALLTVLRNEFVKSIRERGERPDFASLSSYYTQDDDLVILSDISIDIESVRGFISQLEVF